MIKRDLRKFKQICKKTQKELIPYLATTLLHHGYEVFQGDGYIYAKGDIPILLTAHMDTVHKEPVKQVRESTVGNKHYISSPQGIGGDDRCGVYMILEIIKTHKCSVLFCEDEEKGMIGAKKFCESQFILELSDLKYLIELDRAHETDAIFYDCDNPDFTKFITENTGYHEELGSYSDISTLAPKCKVAAVNFSCGYYYAHSTNEYVVWEEMLNTIDVVKKLLEVECEQYEYIARTYSAYGSRYSSIYDTYKNYRNHNYSYGGYYGDYSDYDDDDYYLSGRNPRTDYNSRVDRTPPKHTVSNILPKDNSYDYVLLEVQFLFKDDDNIHRFKTEHIKAKTKNEAWGKFFLQNPSVCYNDVLDHSWDYM